MSESRQSYRALMCGLRLAARSAPLHQTVARWFTAGGVEYSAFARRDHARPSIMVRTSRLSERPRRALETDALTWAAHYRRLAKASPIGRARNLAAARACLGEAAGHFSAFNRLP